MKKILISIVIVLLLVGCTKTEPLVVKPYEIEENSILNIQVYSDEYGKSLQNLWNNYYPDSKIEYTVVNPDAIVNYQTDSDLFYGSLNNLAYFYNEELTSIYPKEFKAFLGFESITTQLEDVGYEKNDFIPLNYTGMTFSYNSKIYNPSEEGLPEEINTFEKVLEIDSSVNVLMNMPFNHPHSMYWLLNYDDFSLIDSIGENHNLSSEKFTEILEFVSLLGDKYNENTLVKWNIEQDLIQNTNHFSIIYSYLQHQLLNNDNYIISQFPTYKGKSFKPLVSIYGYSINSNSNYPKAALELVRLINSVEGKEILIKDNSIIPAIPKETFELFTFASPQQKRYIETLGSSKNETLISLKNNVEKRAFDIYKDIAINEVLKQVYQKEISVNAAQEKLIEAADNWMKEYNADKQ